MMDNPRNLEQEDILDFIDQWLEDQTETTEITKTVAFNLGAKYLFVFLLSFPQNERKIY